MHESALSDKIILENTHLYFVVEGQRIKNNGGINLC